jgi:hypothetical protein
MQYYSNAINPFRQSTINQVFKLVDIEILRKTGNTFVQMLTNNDLDSGLIDDLNNDLKVYDLEIEHFLLFFRLPTVPIKSHVDFFPDGTVCNGSLVLPWLMQNNYTVYWEKGEYNLTKIKPSEQKYNGIEYFEIDWLSGRHICYKQTISQTILVKTDIPHGVFANDKNLLLATVRFRNNPSFEELMQKLGVE